MGLGGKTDAAPAEPAYYSQENRHKAHDTKGKERSIALEEVQKHNTPNDAWLIVAGKVSDKKHKFLKGKRFSGSAYKAKYGLA